MKYIEKILTDIRIQKMYVQQQIAELSAESANEKDELLNQFIKNNLDDYSEKLNELIEIEKLLK